MFSQSICFGEKFAIFAPMRKELGKWLMDIAKYVLTAVVVMSLVSDLGDSRWLIYVFGMLTTAVCLFGGLILIKERTTKTEGE